MKRVAVILTALLITTTIIAFFIPANASAGTEGNPEITDPSGDANDDERPGEGSVDKLDILAVWFSDVSDSTFKITMKIKSVSSLEGGTDYATRWDFGEIRYYAWMDIDKDGNVTNIELKIGDNNWFNVSVISASSSLEWNYSWNTKDVENGIHTIYARAYDGMNHSTIISVDVNVYNEVYNEVSAGGVGKETKINPIYLISAAGIIGAVIIVVVCVLLFRRKRLTGLPANVPPPTPSPVSQPVPFVTAKCPNCGNIMEITVSKRPLKVQCPKCGAKRLLR